MDNVKNNKKKLDKNNIYWWLFLSSVTVVFIVQCVTFILMKRSHETIMPTYTPSVIGTILSVGIMFFYLWWQGKELYFQRINFQKKWFMFWASSLFVYFVLIAYNIAFIPIYLKFAPRLPDLEQNVVFNKILPIMHLVIGFVLSIISIGLQRYSIWKISIDIYRRWYNDHDAQLAKETKKEQENDQKDKKTASSTSGLLDSSTHNNEN